MKPLIKYEEEITPTSSGPFTAKILLSKSDTPTASVRLSMLNENMKLDLHAHDECDQIEYCIKGKIIMFIEGLGEKEVATTKWPEPHVDASLRRRRWRRRRFGGPCR